MFVKKGTYSEQALDVNKSISLLGENANETIINLNPPLINYTFIYLTSLVHSTAITIDSNDVRLSGFTINMPTDGVMSLGGIIAKGDNVEIVGNKLGRECNLQITGTLPSVIDNSISSNLDVVGCNQTITNNQLDNGFDTQGSFSRIAGNTITGVISLNNGTFNLIVNNTFSRLYLEYSDSNFIGNNTCGCLWIGLSGHSCSNNTISKNKVTGPATWGILMGAGSYNVFHDNLLTNFTEGGYGIAIGGNHGAAEHNTFYRNMFINNEWNVGANWKVEGAGNEWDNGKQGNYWDDYTGKDSDGDGIGDTPYTVEGIEGTDSGALVSFVFGQDNHPLMKPFNMDVIILVLPEWASSPSNLLPEPQTTEPFPILPVIIVSVAVVTVIVATALIYSNKRKR